MKMRVKQVLFTVSAKNLTGKRELNNELEKLIRNINKT